MLHSVFSEFALLLIIAAAAGALSLWLAAGIFADTAWSPLAWAQLVAQREYLQVTP